jgi:hypothetical protein
MSSEGVDRRQGGYMHYELRHIAYRAQAPVTECAGDTRAVEGREAATSLLHTHLDMADFGLVRRKRTLCAVHAAAELHLLFADALQFQLLVAHAGAQLKSQTWGKAESRLEHSVTATFAHDQ